MRHKGSLRSKISCSYDNVSRSTDSRDLQGGQIARSIALVSALRLSWGTMNPLWATVGAVAGLIAGAALRNPVFRLAVQPGAPDRTACQRCAAPLPHWPAIRCRRCGASLGRPAVLEFASALVLALLLGRYGGRPETLAFAYLGVVGVALAATDVIAQRLPDRLTLTAIPVLILLLAIAAVADGQAGRLVRSLLGGLAMAGIFLLLAVIRPGQLGGGDIKLAGLLGIALGWLGWTTLIGSTALGFVLGGIGGLVLVALRKATMRSQISFGPFLLSGALIGMLAIGSPGR